MKLMNLIVLFCTAALNVEAHKTFYDASYGPIIIDRYNDTACELHIRREKLHGNRCKTFEKGVRHARFHVPEYHAHARARVKCQVTFFENERCQGVTMGESSFQAESRWSLPYKKHPIFRAHWSECGGIKTEGTEVTYPARSVFPWCWYQPLEHEDFREGEIQT